MERVLQSRRNKHHHSRHLSAHIAAADTCSHCKLRPVIRTVVPYLHPISKSPLRHDLGNLLGKRPSLSHSVPCPLFRPQTSQSHCHVDRRDFQYGFRGRRCRRRHSSTSFPHRLEQLIPFNKRRCASSLLSYGTTDDGPGKPYRACRNV